MAVDLRAEISAIQIEIKKDVAPLQATATDHSQRLTTMENSATFSSDSTEDLLASYNKMTSDINMLQAKCKDLERRS